MILSEVLFSICKHREVAIAIAIFIYGHVTAEERVCTPDDGSRPYKIRWTSGDYVELGGELYAGSRVHWDETGAWRTAGTSYRTAGVDDEGIHRFWFNETRYAFDPSGSTDGRLYHYISKRPATPHETSRLRQYKYDQLPLGTPASTPLPAVTDESITTGYVYVTECTTVEKGSLTLASDYSLLQIVWLYLLAAFQSVDETDDQDESIVKPAQ